MLAINIFVFGFFFCVCVCGMWKVREEQIGMYNSSDRIFQYLYSFSIVAVANYHKFSGLREGFIFL